MHLWLERFSLLVKGAVAALLILASVASQTGCQADVHAQREALLERLPLVAVARADGRPGFSSGVAIGPRRILTARHCLQADPRQEVWGEGLIWLRGSPTGNTTVETRYRVVDSGLPGQADWCIIEVDREMVLPPTAVPLEPNAPIRPGHQVFVAGHPAMKEWDARCFEPEMRKEVFEAFSAGASVIPFVATEPPPWADLPPPDGAVRWADPRSANATNIYITEERFRPLNGMSGGPAVVWTEDRGPVIVGVISGWISHVTDQTSDQALGYRYVISRAVRAAAGEPLIMIPQPDGTVQIRDSSGRDVLLRPDDRSD